MRTMILPAKSILSVAILFTMLVAASLLHAPGALAQTGSASLTGRVTDQSNAVVPDVEVEIKNVDTNVTRWTKTNGDGIYSFSALPPGNYLMNVRKQQFRAVSVTGVELHTQDSLARNFVLEVGSSAESITVNANGEQLSTDSPAVSMTVTRDFVENMPLNGRSFQDLIALAPGTVSSQTSGNGTFSINGQRDDANYFMVDGVSANIGANGPGPGTAGTLPGGTALGTTQALLSVDALEEFRLQTSGYTAEYGRQPGGEVQLTSRSGTNEWHGTVFDYLRNTVFDANSWFANQQGIPRQAERQNDFGGTLGGPLELPGLYNGRDRTFFFFSYEGLRLFLPSFSQSIVPTVAFRQTASSAVQPFMNAFPLPNGPANLADGCTVNTPTGPSPCDAHFNSGYSNPSSVDAISVRVDHNLGDKLRFFGRYTNTPSSAESRGFQVVNQLSATIGNTQTVTLGATAALGPSLVNDFRFNYSQSTDNINQTVDSFGGAVPFAVSLINPPQYLRGDPTEADVTVCPSGTALCNGFTLSSHISEQHQYNFTDGLSWSHGSHVLKFGADYRRLTPLYGFYGPYNGELFFGTVAQVQQGVADDFILASKTVYPQFTNLSLYAQDHWKIASRLTLDYGLRWEFNPSPGEANGLTPLAVTQVNDLATMQLAPQSTSPYRTRYLNFGPRVGFAWDVIPSQSHALVIRGGFGVYYDTGQAEWAYAYSNTTPPFGNLYDAGNVSLPISPAAVPPVVIPSVSELQPPYTGLGLMDPNLKLPYTEQYNLSTDLGVGARNTLTVSYVGNQGHRLLEGHTYLQANPNFPIVTITTNAGASNYNALQLQDRGYLARGLQLVASYTWARAIDNVSTDFSQFAAPVRGNSNNDVRQAFNIAISYEIPGAASNRFVRILTGGWLLANRFTVQSGYPFDVIQGTYRDSANQNVNIYPDLVSGVQLYLHDVPNVPEGWQLNPAAFQPVPLNPDGTPVRQGNLPRNFLRQPGFWNLNTAIQRNFTICEPLHLIFRVEAFNIFNHPNFGSVDNGLVDSTFGQLLGTQTIGTANQLYATGSPRSLQFMLKVQF